MDEEKIRTFLSITMDLCDEMLSHPDSDNVGYEVIIQCLEIFAHLTNTYSYLNAMKI